MKGETYLSFRWVSASLEFDRSIGIGRMRASVLVMHPDVSNDTNIDTNDDCMRRSVLTTAASVQVGEKENNKSRM